MILTRWANLWKTLRANKHKLTKQQYKTIKGQIKAGDIEGARKGLTRLLARQSQTV